MPLPVLGQFSPGFGQPSVSGGLSGCGHSHETEGPGHDSKRSADWRNTVVSQSCTIGNHRPGSRKSTSSDGVCLESITASRRGYFLTSTRVTMPRSRRRWGVQARALAWCSHEAPTRRSGQVKEPPVRRVAKLSAACIATAALALTATACGSTSSEKDSSSSRLVVGRRQGRHQDRPRLRRRRPWRPLLQRLRRPRRRQGREGVRRSSQGADRQGRRHRGRPRAAPDQPGRRRLQPDRRRRLRLRRTSVDKVAEKYPKTNFGLVDSVVDAKNVDSIVFTEEQGSYLAGVAAALKTKNEPRRLHRRRRHPADQEVRGRLHAGRQGHQPEGQGRRPVPDPRLGLLRLRQPRQGQGRRRRACSTTAPT